MWVEGRIQLKGDTFEPGDLCTYDDHNYFGTSAIFWRVVKVKSLKSGSTNGWLRQVLWVEPAFCITGHEIPLKNKRVGNEQVKKLDLVQVGIIHQRFVEFIRAAFVQDEAVKPEENV